MHVSHKFFILIGSLLWCASFFGESFNFQPYSTYGLVLSPVLVGFGVFKWLNNYKAIRGHYPQFLSVYKSIYRKQREGDFFVGTKFMLSHIPEMWAFIIVFWMGIFLLGYLTFTNSAPFEATKIYCQSSSEVLSKTGRINGFGVLVGGTIKTQGETGSADLSFTILGEKGNFSAYSELVKKDNKWTVKELTVH